MNVQPFAIKTVDETVNFYVPVPPPKLWTKRNTSPTSNYFDARVTASISVRYCLDTVSCHRCTDWKPAKKNRLTPKELLGVLCSLRRESSADVARAAGVRHTQNS